ncbi:bifunctional pyrimidine regulatory protein PyrR uracil phosphoribosyltransferase [Lapidilactobacillus dextrinicus DSM 20335]|uniref:Bifunctional protein PyrR n=1 Tax=Lapidilactobacillus dextrinicus DSM 20335 TaxID=1423738 RepID=A0A0R2BI98_9LACO|nr:bifunctional pyr operon transcriptional regulator/uracil phosphoribosyltransferase PyrR [Lapidilactobacillus dextrinicus]KRM79240.1 bifunctional pyrimidine regulatory protein PyrR uracil phosphoribosyltransferase [Lapidilactobacillus dextrinicus DSM 20335]QFG46918.1 bifunctional pyr operon transcriptional regulator/uracil phosphoribosyltransferase PyrR [Lapidilactobacillus dextrinicus]
MAKVIMDQTGIQRALTRITYEIIEQNRGLTNLIIVGIRTRGAYLATRIGQRIEQLEGTKIPVVFLDVTDYRDDRPASRTKTTQLDDKINGKNIVLVDDVLYTGRTIRAALDAIMDSGRPQKISLAVLIDRGHRELPIRPDFVGKNIPTAHDETINVQMTEVDQVDQVILN